MTRSRQSPAKAKSDKGQRKRFVEAARQLGASEDEAAFDEALKRIAKQKPKDESGKGHD